MPEKYHISPKTNKANKCSATKRACRYGNSKHYASLQEAEAASKGQQLKATIRKELTKKKQPVIVEYSPLNEPNVSMDLQWHGGLEGDYEGYGHEFGYECTSDPDDYCRDQVYFGLTMAQNDNVDVKAILSTMFRTKKEDLPSELIDYAESLGLSSSDAYEATATWGYYGQEYDIYLKEEKQKALKDWYFSRSNARDEGGVLDYCRSKGLPTAGLTPLEAIKKQLADENNGLAHPKVEEAYSVEVADLTLGTIVTGNADHYSRIDPRPAESFTNGEIIMGVLIVPKSSYKWWDRNIRVNEGFLVDGYHRLKHARNNQRRKGKFIILNFHDTRTPTSIDFKQ